LADIDGVTPQGMKLEPGKLVQDSPQKYQQMTRLVGCGSETPLMAALISPLSSQQARLFQINCWTVSTDPRQPSSYTVVKEVKPVPAVMLEHKLAFGLLVVKSIGGDRDFVKWANNWITGADRSQETAQALLKAEEAERQAAADLGDLAAWGQTGTDDQHSQDLDEATQRGSYLLRAAVLYPDASKADEVMELIAQAMSKLASRDNLEALAEQAMATAGGKPASAASG